MKRKPEKDKNGLRAGRVVVNLNREEFEFVDKIGRDALFTAGKRLTNNKIIRTFISVMREIGISGDGLCNCEELKERILRTLGIRKERRGFPRFKKEVKVSWRKLESLSRHEAGSAIDIGMAGFRIELKEKRKAGETLEFTLHDPAMPDNPIRAYGRIAWVRGKEAGIKLTYLPDENVDRFNKLFCDTAREAMEANKKRRALV